MQRVVIITMLAFIALFIATGLAIIYYEGKPETELGKALKAFMTPIFSAHMFCWMVLGMVANYLWDLFRSGKGMAQIRIPDLILPLLVSPIVFFGIWSIWPEDREISFALNLVAFQNGFFWQVVLSKAGPVTGQRSDPDQPNQGPNQGP